MEAIYCECSATDLPGALRTLSRQSAPPDRRHTSFWLVLTLFFTAISAVALFTGEESSIAFAACTMLSGRMSRDSMRYNRADFPRLLDYWHRSFICMRCGEVYVPA